VVAETEGYDSHRQDCHSRGPGTCASLDGPYSVVLLLNRTCAVKQWLDGIRADLMHQPTTHKTKAMWGFLTLSAPLPLFTTFLVVNNIAWIIPPFSGLASLWIITFIAAVIQFTVVAWLLYYVFLRNDVTK
jgi:hypothetical protein